METLLIRFGEIGTKSGKVRSEMVNTLRQRVEDRLVFEDAEYEKVSRKPGRIIVRNTEPREISEYISLLPGVKSCSPAYVSEPALSEVREKAEAIEPGQSFGIRANVSGSHGFGSQEVERKLGDFLLEDETEVDLDNPETWIRVDVRDDEAFIFEEKVKGPGGFPVGSEGSLAALVSGGIDSPVAAYRAMVRGCEVVPIYFYNRPLAAEDHLMRFESVISEMKKFNPGKKWFYYVVDMKEINQKLMEVGSGRMVLHRRLMFRVAEKIAAEEGLKGLVTGESVGQKSSQTPQNLKVTSSAVEIPVHRPLLSFNKSRIVEEAREIGTYDISEIDSACRSLAPEKPSTALTDEELDVLESDLDRDRMVDSAFRSAEKKSL